MYELKNGSARLVGALEVVSEDQNAVQQIAATLKYDPSQLKQDINALSAFHSFYDLWSNNAAAGYAIAAAQAASLDRKQTEKLLAAMTAAFDKMTVDEAKDLYEAEDL